MRARKYGMVAVCLLIVLASGAGGVYWATLSTPQFYESALKPAQAPLSRKEAAKSFTEQTTALAEEIRHADVWSEDFSQTQVNSWIAEELHQKYGKIVPKGVHDPRIAFTDDLALLGFRFETRDWKGIVSLEVKPSVPAPGQLALEVRSVKAGLLPIPTEEVLKNMAKEVRAEGFRMELIRSEGSETILVHFDHEKPGTPVLETVEVGDGNVRVAGSREPKQTAQAETRVSQVQQVSGEAVRRN